MKKLFPLFFILLLFTAIVGTLLTIADFSSAPVEKEIVFEMPVFAVRGADDSMAVIDHSQRRILKVLSDGSLDFMIRGGSRNSNRFFYTQEIAIGPNGHLFLINQVLDTQGFTLIREELQEYDARGRYLKTIYQVDLESKAYQMSQRGWCCSLKATPDAVSWFELGTEGVEYHVYRPSNPLSHEFLPLPEAHLGLIDISRIEDGYVYSHKSGKIIRCDLAGKNEAVLYDADRSERRSSFGVPSVPWEIEVQPDGSVDYVDLPHREICRRAPDGSVRVLFSEKAENDIYRFSTSPSGLLTLCDETTVFTINPATINPADPATLEARTSVTFSSFQRARRMAFWGFALLDFVLACFVLRWFFVHVCHGTLSRGFLQSLGVLFVIGMTLLVSFPSPLHQFVNQQQGLLLEQLEMMIRTIPRTIDADLIERLDTADSYMNEDYRKLRTQLHEAYSGKDYKNDCWYFALYRVYGDRTFGLLYDNDQIGPFYPYIWAPEKRRTVLDGNIFTAVESDQAGAWIYGIGPVFNDKGEVVAIFETGMDVYAKTLATRKMLVQTLLDILTLLIVLILCMFELIFFLNARQNMLRTKIEHQGNKRRKEDERFSPVFLVRMLIFLQFAALSFPGAFLPLLVKPFYDPSLSVSEEFFLALPTTIEMLAFAAGTILASKTIPVFGLKGNLYAACFCSAAGCLSIALAPNAPMLLASFVPVGLGNGLGFIAIRSQLLLEPDQERRDRGFSYFYSGMIAGMYVGILLGASLADLVGYQSVFFISAAVFLLAWIYAVVYTSPLEKVFRPDRTKPMSEKPKPIGDLAFVFHRKILAYHLLHLIPFYVASAFMNYFFPIFAEDSGLNAGNIGRILVLNGLVIIFIGPPVSQFVLRLIGGPWTILVGQIVWALGFFFFVLFPSIAGAAVAMMIFGLAESICIIGENNYYLGLKTVKAYGEEKAIAMSELIGKGGDAVGPLVFAFALAFGPLLGLFGLGVACLLTGFLFIWTRERTQRAGDELFE